MIPRETQEGAFYRAALALHQNHFQQAQGVSSNPQQLIIQNCVVINTLMGAAGLCVCKNNNCPLKFSLAQNGGS